MYAGSLDFLPLWSLFPITAGISLLFVWLGYRLGAYRRRCAGTGDSGPAGTIIAATLGLLAFMLALSYGSASSNFEIRRQSVVNEASTIGSSYSIANLLPEPHGAEIRNLLRDYVKTRANDWRTEQVQTTITQSEELIGQIWSKVEAIQDENRDSVVSVLFVQSFTQVTSIQDNRAAETTHHVLPTIWIVLYFVSAMAMAAVGFQSGLAGKYNLLVILTLVLAFAAVMWLLADFDRPMSGTLMTSQQPMFDLLQKLVPSGK